jgi:hypothetical protein
MGGTAGTVKAAVRAAALNICFTAEDRQGLGQIVARAARRPRPVHRRRALPRAAPPEGADGPVRLVTVAMMRGGAKLASYEMLARALARIAGEPWTLDVVGDGPQRPAVAAAFARLPGDRVHWAGEGDAHAVARHLAAADMFVWPGTGEAYGIAYLEAQAAGLPVVAQDTAGVPAVVRHGLTGLLSPEGDDAALAAAIARLIRDAGLRRRLGAAARKFVAEERSLPAAAARLRQLLHPPARPCPGRAMKELLAELDRCAETGRRVTFWLRDDDAVAVTAELERLHALAGQWSIPLVLAVIPMPAEPELARSASPISTASGWRRTASPTATTPRREKRNRNWRAPPGRDGARRDQAGARAAGRIVSRQNRADAGAAVEPHRGTSSLTCRTSASAGSRPSARTRRPARCRTSSRSTASSTSSTGAPAPHIPTTAGGQAGRTGAPARAPVSAPIGILSHHLAHDEAAWAFLADLFRLTARHQAATWAWPDAGYAG